MNEKKSYSKRRRLIVEKYLKSKEENKVSQNQLINFYVETFGVGIQTFNNDMKILEANRILKRIENVEYVLIPRINGENEIQQEPEHENYDDDDR